MAIATVWVEASLDNCSTITKSSSVNAKITAALAKMEGPKRGSVTRPSARRGEAPKSNAASSNSGPSDNSRARTMTTGYASASTTSPNSWAVVPRPMNLKALMNIRNSDTARISSGVTNEKSMRKFDAADVRVRHRWRASANATASGTDIKTVREASFKLCTTAWRSAGSCSTELFGSETYHFVEKPCHCEIDRPLLNENKTAVATGMRDHST